MSRERFQKKKRPAVKQLTSHSARIKQSFHLAGLLIFCFCLNLIGLEWGCSGHVPWQPDSIEGIVILSQMPATFSTWTHKYPRGQFLIN